MNMKTFMKFFLVMLATLTVIEAQAKLNVVATTWDFGAIAQEIGGDKIELVTLAKATEDPHFVDAKPSYIVKLNHADALIEGGAELEVGWLPPLLDGARNAKLESGQPGHIMGSEGISLLEIPATLDRSKGDVHAGGNPHYMPDPLNGRIVAGHIANALSQLDPKSADYFQANLSAFQARLDAKMVDWNKQLAPYRGKQVVSYHNYWIYFAKRFGLKMDLYLEPKPGIPPTPAHLAEVITKMKADKVNVIVIQPYQDRKTATTVASHTGATVVDFPSFPAGPGRSYEDWMDGLVSSLATAFDAAK
jgi:zinc/manganese transport system substrate-binding protein